MIQEETIVIGALKLDCGATLAAVDQRVTIYGIPKPDGSNVVLVMHALSGSGRAAEWWPGIVGDGALFDLREWCVVGVNALGSCYSSTGPEALAPDGARYGDGFPRITVRDIAQAEMQALRRIGIDRFSS